MLDYAPSLRRNVKPVRAIRAALAGFVSLSTNFPHARARKAATHIIKDVPYSTEGYVEHRLDVIRMRSAEGVQPALLYVHGGAFAVCSKETHEILTHQYARMGFTVFSMDYRLMPEHRFPAAFHDACAALLWVMENAEQYGADASKLVIGGESAGANLSLGLAAAASYRDEDDVWAQRVYDANPTIVAVMPACGVLQVSGINRLWSNHRFDPITRGVLSAMQRDYLPEVDSLTGPTLWADPLLVVERRALTRPLPPMFTFCGTGDVLLHDTIRLGARLRKLGVRSECEIYPGEMHAFHALVWRPGARKVWRQKRAFLQELLPELPRRPSAAASRG